MSKGVSIETIKSAKFVFEDCDYTKGWNAALEALLRFAKLEEVEVDGEDTERHSGENG